jgi:hypothetical protein
LRAVSAGKTVGAIVASISTTKTGVTIPAGILTSGEAYAIAITADNNPNPNAPNRLTLPTEESTIASGVITAR